MQYPFLRQGLPEVMVDIGRPIIVDGEIDKDEFTEYVEKDLTNLLNNQLKEISNGEIEKYNTVLFKKLLLKTHLFKHPVMGHYPEFGEHCCLIKLMINFKG